MEKGIEEGEMVMEGKKLVGREEGRKKRRKEIREENRWEAE